MASVLSALAERLEWASIMLWASFALSWGVAYVPFASWLEQLQIRMRHLGRKLNRRGVETQAWRGVVVMGAITLPALIGGSWLAAKMPVSQEALLLLLIFSISLRSREMLKLWQAGRHKRLTLQKENPRHLFTDTHGLLRHEILSHATSFSIGVVGSFFWFCLAGLPGLFIYLALALLAASYATIHDENKAFGGVVSALFAFMDAVPKLLAALLLMLAGLLVPGCKPWRALPALGRWTRCLALLLDISLGGPSPIAGRTSQAPWEGRGTAQLEPKHLTRWLLLWLVTLLMGAVFATLSQIIY